MTDRRKLSKAAYWIITSDFRSFVQTDSKQGLTTYSIPPRRCHYNFMARLHHTISIKAAWPPSAPPHLLWLQKPQCTLLALLISQMPLQLSIWSPAFHCRHMYGAGATLVTDLFASAIRSSGCFSPSIFRLPCSHLFFVFIPSSYFVLLLSVLPSRNSDPR